MSDENSTSIWTTQTSTNQTWNDNDFVLNFWEEEKNEEVKNSEEHAEENFDVNTENGGVDDENGIGQNSNDDLFWDSQNEDNEDLNLWNIATDIQNKEDNKNDDFFSGMNLNSERDGKQEQSNTKMEENNEISNEAKPDVSSSSTEENFSLDMEPNVESNQDDSFWEKDEGDNKLGQETIEMDRQENNANDNSDFLMTMDWTTDEESNDILGQQDLKQESTYIQWDNTENDIDFSFDINDSNRWNIENKIEEKDTNTNKLEEMFAGNWSDAAMASEENVENTDNNNVISDFTIDYQNSVSQDIVQNNLQNDERQEDKSTELSRDDLFWDGPLIQNEDNKNWDNQNLTYNNSVEWDKQENWELLLNNIISWDENKDGAESENIQDQELIAARDSTESQEVSQPDMMNLLWWQPIDFSYEENVTDIQQSENNAEGDQDSQDVFSMDLQDSSNATVMANQNEEDNSMTEDKSDSNLVEDMKITNSDNEMKNQEKNNNLNAEDQWDNIQNLEENKISELSTDLPNDIPQINENTQNQVEIWSIKSTLSLDEILDSELQSNPQFADNSRSVPKNIQTKSMSLGSKKMTIFMWLGVFLLLCFVVVLAFPSVSSERKTWDVVDMVNTDTIVDEPEIIEKEEIVDESDLNVPEDDETIEDYQGEWEQIKKEEEDIGWGHGAWPTLELIEEEYTPPEEIEPYNLEETEQEEELLTEETENISVEDIQLKISSFKSQGEWYKKVGENESNEKVIKYASYVIRLCEDYQLQINNWEWIDEETYFWFETKVSWFISKIEMNLHPWEEVEVVYTQAKLDNDEEKEATRTYLENR